jgi:flagellar biosynthetic protein FliQ
MDDVFVANVMRQGLTTVLTVAGPMLAVGMIVGLIISVFQATTQIQEQTLSFIPKILAIFLTLIIGSPWMVRVLVDFTNELYAYLTEVTRW